MALNYTKQQNSYMFKSSIKPALIFDLDETLIHSFTTPQLNSFEITIDSTNQGNQFGKKLYVRVRNGASLLLGWLQSQFNIFIFTSASKEYADQIIDHIAPQIPQEHRFYRDSIKYLNNKYSQRRSSRGRGFKDISIITKRFSYVELTKTLLIDNSKHCGLCNPSNTVVIKPWNGLDDDDTILMDVLYPILTDIAQEDNLLTSLKQQFILDPISLRGLSIYTTR